jgi:tRNA(Arg) A34 adenosine deaminase TadA
MDYMALALQAMRSGKAPGDPPVGAVLVIGDEVVGAARNRIVSARSFIAHAENSLLIRHSDVMFRAFMGKPRRSATIYTTLEPCLLCTAAAAHSRVARIVYACRDTMAGCCNHSPPDGWYRENWPVLEHDPRHEQDVAQTVFDSTAGRGPLAAAMRDVLGPA